MNELLRRCASFLCQHHAEAYLVGGAVRDALLGRECHDLDVVVPCDALKIARELADVLGGAYYPLDEERETGRIVMPDRNVIDVALLRGGTIEADLALRDFTINAMARRITSPLVPLLTREGSLLLDPHQGIRDLRAQVIRAVGEQTFIADPVRVLRAVRLADTLGYTLDTRTAQLLRQAMPLLTQVSGERVRDEFTKILERQNSAQTFDYWYDYALWQLVLPRARWNAERAQRLDWQEQTVMILCRAGLLFEAARERLCADLAVELTGGHTRKLMLKLAVFYDDENACANDLRALKFSRHEIEYATALVRCRNYFSTLPASPEALHAHRFFRDCGAAALGVIAFGFPWATDATAAAAAANALLRHYLENYERVITPKPLINGAYIAEHFGLQGPHIGQCLRALLEAQVSGTVQSVADAEKFVTDGGWRIASSQ
jgi:tRNA nucleotidyltransferase/poly(A) polymerase